MCRPLQSGKVSDVSLEGCCPLTELAGKLLQWVKSAPDDGDIRALGVGLASDFGAESARGAGDEHNSAVEIEPRGTAEQPADKRQGTDQLRAGAGNEEHPVVFYNTTTGQYWHFIGNQEPLIGHLDGLLSTSDGLFMSDMADGSLFGAPTNTGICMR